MKFLWVGVDEGQNFLRLRRASSYCSTPYSRTTRAHVHTQTHTRLFFASAHRKDCNNKDSKDRNHRSAMQAFLLLFGLLFRPGASVRLKTVGESWEGPTLDGPQAIIPVSQLYPALTQDENATWFTIHTVGTFACINIYIYRIRIQCTYTYFSLPHKRNRFAHCAEGLRKSQKSFGRRKKRGGKTFG